MASERLESRIAPYVDALSKDVINIRMIRELSCFGCPEGKRIRQTCWKSLAYMCATTMSFCRSQLLLNYLPLERSNWEKYLSDQRALYRQFVAETILNPHKFEGGNDGTLIDHPLNPNPSGAWTQYFQDNEQLLQIDHDCRRLYPDIAFFQQPTKFPFKAYKTGSVMQLDSLKSRVDKSALPSQMLQTSRGGTKNFGMLSKSAEATPYEALAEGEEAHWEVCERMLFVYSKINKGIKYVQGMNEIIGPLYYVLASDPDPTSQEYAEADTFFCFVTLMGEISDNFNQTMDKSKYGIEGTLRRFDQLLKKADSEVHVHLEKQQLRPQFYAFRWITLLLSQEFFLPDVIEIWDCLFSDVNRYEFLYYICCAMIVLVREQLLSNEFANNLKLLQNYPRTISVRSLINEAEKLRKRIKKMAAHEL